VPAAGGTGELLWIILNASSPNSSPRFAPSASTPRCWFDILEDLCRPNPLFAMCVLRSLPDKELPELDDILMAHLNNRQDDIERAALIIERYGEQQGDRNKGYPFSELIMPERWSFMVILPMLR
jgi:hypothetical protein